MIKTEMELMKELESQGIDISKYKNNKDFVEKGSLRGNSQKSFIKEVERLYLTVEPLKKKKSEDRKYKVSDPVSSIGNTEYTELELFEIIEQHGGKSKKEYLESKCYLKDGYLRKGTGIQKTFERQLLDVFNEVNMKRKKKGQPAKYEVGEMRSIVKPIKDGRNGNSGYSIVEKENKILEYAIKSRIAGDIKDKNATKKYTKKELYGLLGIPIRNYVSVSKENDSYFSYYRTPFNKMINMYEKNVVDLCLKKLKEKEIIDYKYCRYQYEITLLKKSQCSFYSDEHIRDVFFEKLEKLVAYRIKRLDRNSSAYDLMEFDVLKMYQDLYVYKNEMSFEVLIEKYGKCFSHKGFAPSQPKGFKMRNSFNISGVNNIKDFDLDIKPTVYEFLNKNEEIIYIGQTTDISDRLKNHFSYTGHLDKKCYEEVSRIRYATYNLKGDMELMETYLITKHLPLYNKKGCFQSSVLNGLNVPEPNWENVPDLLLRQLKSSVNTNAV